MFGKNWETRLTETITFIRTANVTANAGLRELVADILQYKYRPIIPQATSVAMSQGTLWNLTGRTELKVIRKYRRAIILIRSVIFGALPATAAAAAGLIPDLNLPGSLGALLLLVEQHEEGVLRTALTNLRTNPAAFLAVHQIHMEAQGGSGAKAFAFYYNVSRRRYDFMRANRVVGTELQIPGPTGAGIRVSYILPTLHNVHVQDYSAIRLALGAIVGAVLDNTDNVMVTTQLSGCSIVYETQGTDLVAAHIQPMRGDAHGGGINLVVTLRANAGFANGIGAGVEVFGASDNPAQRNYVPGRYTYCIGIKRNGAWELHAQQHFNTVGDVPITWQIEP